MSSIQTVNPATGETLNTYPVMTENEAIEKVEAAHSAFQEWRQKSHEERAPYLLKIAEALRSHSDELAELMTKETGKLLKDGKTEVEICAAIFEYSAKNGPDVLPTRSAPMAATVRGVWSPISQSV